MKSKGMSQILVLIVAAAVLMMVGLLLVSLSGNSIGNLGTDTKTAACSNQIQNTCRTQGEIEDLPSTCQGLDPSTLPELRGEIGNPKPETCSNVLN